MQPLLASFVLPLASLCAQEPAPRETDAFVTEHCITCHGGDTTKGKLDLTRTAPDAVQELWRWSRMRERVRTREMPPPDADRPTDADGPSDADRAAFVAAVG